ncbi:amidohydrolase family protein [Enterococcus sp. AZ109]|uniref:amidohydrolase family protein n=1 Tax=Enterococcus sp. AZ109 TaxID=2774634 RepID=UPI003F21CCD6
MKIFDSHLHIIEPNYPIITNNGFTPEVYTVEDYQTELANQGIEARGGAVVAGSFQGFDQTYLENALTKLGPDFVGITQLPIETSDEEIVRLDQIGVRGIRFNLYRGVSESIQTIEAFSARVYDLVKWKTEFYLDLDTLSEELKKVILKLPKASIDHLGMGSSSKDKLKRLLASGVTVKVTGFGRIDYTREQLITLLPELYAENPDGLIFGSDLPSTRSPERFNIKDIALIQTIFSEVQAEKILLKNAQNWYLTK